MSTTTSSARDMTVWGKSVLITGAGRGLGQALVAEALERGAARVYAAARQRVRPHLSKHRRGMADRSHCRTGKAERGTRVRSAATTTTPTGGPHRGMKDRTVNLTSELPPADRDRVHARLRHNLMAWLTTVRPSGQPVCVPVWFLLREDDTILLYSRPGQEKLRNIAVNPKVSLTLDVTDIGRDIVRIEGLARQVHDQPAADDNPAYLTKYTERIAAMFHTPDHFAALFSATLSITPTRLRT